MKYISAKSLLIKQKPTKYWFDLEYMMNIYRGCNHGCIYCDSRSDCYRIDNFDEVRAKKDCISIIKRELGYRRKGVIGTGSMSDPYNTLEKKYELTKQALELFDRHKFGVAIATKSDLVKRDISILKSIKEHSPVLVKLTITTFDDDLCKIIEPHVAVTSKRFDALKALSKEDIFSGVLLMPLLPYINDNEENIVSIVRGVAESGGKFIYAAFGLTMRDSQRDYLYQKLDKHFPNLKEKYMANYGSWYSCKVPNYKELKTIFVNECKKNGLLYRISDINKAFRNGYKEPEQLKLF